MAASPERLVCVVFEQLVINLERALIAMERGDIEGRVVALGRARGLVVELLSSLDVEKGGGLGVDLAGIYQVMLVELLDVGRRNDLHVMKKLVTIAASLRDGFVGAERQLAAQRLKTA